MCGKGSPCAGLPFLFLRVVKTIGIYFLAGKQRMSTGLLHTLSRFEHSLNLAAVLPQCWTDTGLSRRSRKF